MDDLERAYDTLDYELVQATDKVTVPSSTPAHFEYRKGPTNTELHEIEDRLNASEFAFIDISGDSGETWYEFYLSAKASGPGPEDQARVKLSTAGVTILQDRQEKMSMEFFFDLVHIFEDTLGVDLVYEGGVR